ncbi:MAG: hypothetical protein AAB511_03280 [Patescibacteria group bacterium]|mgnify:CR=1 FL=1
MRSLLQVLSTIVFSALLPILGCANMVVGILYLVTMTLLTVFLRWDAEIKGWKPKINEWGPHTVLFESSMVASSHIFLALLVVGFVYPLAAEYAETVGNVIWGTFFHVIHYARGILGGALAATLLGLIVGWTLGDGRNGNSLAMLVAAFCASMLSANVLLRTPPLAPEHLGQWILFSVFGLAGCGFALYHKTGAILTWGSKVPLK